MPELNTPPTTSEVSLLRAERQELGNRGAVEERIATGKQDAVDVGLAHDIQADRHPR
jgi:hypothetical protein